MSTTSVADLLADLNVPHELDAPLGPRTWYGLGGVAEVLARPASVAQLARLVARCHELAVPVRVLGGGANLLVADEGVPGVVVTLSDPAFAGLEVEGVRLHAGGGHDLFKLVTSAARAGLSGLEAIAGIPGTVGGALRMNAGGAWGEIGSVVEQVQLMSATGQVYHRHRQELQFGYRRSSIDAPLILGATFELSEDDPEQVMRQVKEIFFHKKNAQPMSAASAGCAFKNPPPEVGRTAGQLIDEAGLKGHRLGSAFVSQVHANFIAADRGGRANDIRQLMEHVQQVVLDRFGVRLEREVVVWP